MSATFVGVCEQAVSRPAFLLDPTPLSTMLTLLSSVNVLHITIIVIISTCEIITDKYKSVSIYLQYLSLDDSLRSFYTVTYNISVD